MDAAHNAHASILSSTVLCLLQHAYTLHPALINCSLGLGAKFLPHKKGMGVVAALDERLQKRLQSNTKRAEAAHKQAQEQEERCACWHDA